MVVSSLEEKFLKAGLLDKCGGELIHLISAAHAASRFFLTSQ
jgi:hypothetical protein